MASNISLHHRAILGGRRGMYQTDFVLTPDGQAAARAWVASHLDPRCRQNGKNVVAEVLSNVQIHSRHPQEPEHVVVEAEGEMLAIGHFSHSQHEREILGGIQGGTPIVDGGDAAWRLLYHGSLQVGLLMVECLASEVRVENDWLIIRLKSDDDD